MLALGMQLKWLVGGAVAAAALAAAVASAVLRETARPLPARQESGNTHDRTRRPAAVSGAPSAAGRMSPPVLELRPPPSMQAPPPAKASSADRRLLFDVVRVEPTGAAVIAGHGIPGIRVVLLDGDRRVDTVESDAAGQFVFLPPALAAGQHALWLAPEDSARTSAGREGVAVTVPADGKGQVVVSALAKGAAGPVAAASSTEAQPVTIRSIEIDPHGALVVTGTGAQEHALHLLLNRGFVAAVQPQADRRWSVRVEKGLEPGRYDVQVEDRRENDGEVVASAQATFEYAGVIQRSAGAPDWEGVFAAALGPDPVVAAARSLGSPDAANPRQVQAEPTSKSAPERLAGSGTSARATQPRSPPGRATPPSAATAEAHPSIRGRFGVAPTVARQGPVRPTSASLASQQAGNRTAARPVVIGARHVVVALVGRRRIPPIVPTARLRAGSGAAAARARRVGPVRLSIRYGRPMPTIRPLPKPARVDQPASDVRGSRDVHSPRGAHAVVPQLRTIVVRPGDNLWTISQAAYGAGPTYGRIVQANGPRIRNPQRIFAGQVFVLPAPPPAGKR